MASGQVVERYGIPTAYFHGLLDGLAGDLSPVRVVTFDELRLYCFRVAGTVGLTMCHVLGATGAPALAAATDLAIAMQLTNVLRDLGGDLARDRVYLPAEELARFDYSADRLFALFARHAAGGPPDPELRELLRFQIERARAHYDRELAGVWLLPPAARPAILVAGRLYRAILDVIEQRRYDVLSRRAATSKLRKAREATVSILLHGLWGRRPTPAELALGAPDESGRAGLAWLTEGLARPADATATVRLPQPGVCS